MTTTSAPESTASRTASAPSLAVPTSSRSGAVASRVASPRRTTAWSSATNTLITAQAP